MPTVSAQPLCRQPCNRWRPWWQTIRSGSLSDFAQYRAANASGAGDAALILIRSVETALECRKPRAAAGPQQGITVLRRGRIGERLRGAASRRATSPCRRPSRPRGWCAVCLTATRPCRPIFLEGARSAAVRRTCRTSFIDVTAWSVGLMAGVDVTLLQCGGIGRGASRPTLRLRRSPKVRAPSPWLLAVERQRAGAFCHPVPLRRGAGGARHRQGLHHSVAATSPRGTGGVPGWQQHAGTDGGAYFSALSAREAGAFIRWRSIRVGR